MHLLHTQLQQIRERLELTRLDQRLIEFGFVSADRTTLKFNGLKGSLFVIEGHKQYKLTMTPAP